MTVEHESVPISVISQYFSDDNDDDDEKFQLKMWKLLGSISQHRIKGAANLVPKDWPCSRLVEFISTYRCP